MKVATSCNVLQVLTSNSTSFIINLTYTQLVLLAVELLLFFYLTPAKKKIEKTHTRSISPTPHLAVDNVSEAGLGALTSL